MSARIVHRLRKEFRQDGGVKDGVLLADVVEGVIVGPDAVEITIDVEGRAALGPLEDHVLEEVRDAAHLRQVSSARARSERRSPRPPTSGRGTRLADDLQGPLGMLVAMKRHEKVSLANPLTPQYPLPA